MLHLGLLQSLKYSHMSQIYSGLPRCHDSLSTKNEILQIGEASSLIFYLIYIVCQIPMVEMFATNMSHKLPFYVASPGCKFSEHRWIKTSCWRFWTARPFVLYHLFLKVIELVNIRCKMIVVAPWWPMMHWLWGLVTHSTIPPLQLLHWSQKQPFNQKYHLNLLHWHLHAWYLYTTQNLLYHSLG